MIRYSLVLMAVLVQFGLASAQSGQLSNDSSLVLAFRPTEKKPLGSIDSVITYRKSPRKPVKPNHRVMASSAHFRRPHPETPQSRYDQTLNHINTLRKYFPELTGFTETLAIKEALFDTTDLDLSGRYLSSNLETSGYNQHATDMATIAAGNGTSFYTGLGVAPEALLTSSDFSRLFPDPNDFFTEKDIHVQNHSYGLGIENFYGAEARAYDKQVFELLTLSHIFSAGNAGQVTPDTGRYAGLPAVANLTGTFKQAKNIIVVGAVDSAGQIESRSSRGPAFDGRIKPELVAFGQDGSSGAAAITSGVAILMQQLYFHQYGQPMPAALLKAFLINGARDLGEIGPDFIYGYGLVDALKTLKQVQNSQFFTGILSAGKKQQFSLQIPEEAHNLKITLAWTDPPAEVLTENALTNDLDLSLSNPEAKVVIYPWVAFTHPDSLQQPAQRAKDHLNPQEQISIQNPAPGTYQIQVEASRLKHSVSQEFYLAYDWDQGFETTWVYPLRNDPVRAGRSSFLRWSTRKLLSPIAHLEFKWTGNDNWIFLDEVHLQEQQWLWTAPDSFGTAQLRLRNEFQTAWSDTFLVSTPLDLSIAYQCDDEILAEWTPAPQALAYEFLQFEKNGAIKTSITTDPYFNLQNVSDPDDTHLAVRPILADGRSGIRSLAINVGFQNASCYVSRFSGKENHTSIELELNLQSEFGLYEIVVEKILPKGSLILHQMEPNGKFIYHIQDPQPYPGINLYQVTLYFSNGRSPITRTAFVSYLGSEQAVLFNSQTSENGLFMQIQPEQVGAILEIYDMQGRKLSQLDLLSTFESIPTHHLSSGIFAYRLIREGVIQAEGTFHLVR